jgi:hypothetical protein
MAVSKKPVRKPGSKKPVAAQTRKKSAVQTKATFAQVKSKLAKYPRLKILAIQFGIPLLFYFIFFWIYAGTWMGHFNTRFFADQGDGFQNVWNMWWINYAVVHLHQLPWHTFMLHYPYGTTLLGQTMNPFNGFVGIFLMHVLHLSLVQSFNTMIIFSFAFGGVTAFWLCYYFTKKYIPSLIGGFLYTFSSYHFAHAIGHMQLVSLEWIPLFILLWWKLLKNPRYRTAIGAAIVLLLVLFCDYYYFLYSLGAAALILVYLWHKKELAPIKENYRAYLSFIILSLIIVAPLPLALLRSNSRDPLQGAHDARLFSTDILTPIIDGGFWHFAWLTHRYWHNVKAYIAESSVYFGVSTIVLIIIAVWKRAKIHRDIVFWLVLGAIFGIISMGPRLMILGYSINHAPMPYALLEILLPTLKLSGDPDRFIAMSFLAASVIVAMVLARLDLSQRKGQLLIGLFFVVLAFELWPNILPTNVASAYPAYVNALKKLPAGAVLDNGALSYTWQVYDQTITDKPIALGYISRTPTSVMNEDAQLVATVNPAGYPKLCSEWKIRYVTTPASRPLKTNFPIIYNDHQTLIYDFKDSPNC